MVFIHGNHDKVMKKRKDVFLHDILDIYVDEQPITLCHYPMVSWNKSHFGAWMLHGHHHRDTSALPEFSGKKMNMFFGNYGYRPVHFSQVKEFMDKRPDNWDFIKR